MPNFSPVSLFCSAALFYFMSLFFFFLLGLLSFAGSGVWAAACGNKEQVPPSHRSSTCFFGRPVLPPLNLLAVDCLIVLLAFSNVV
jgi:hypothetical protein